MARTQDWYKEDSDADGTQTSDSSPGAIPAVKPFNFGRHLEEPDDKALYLTVPKLGLMDRPIYNSVGDEKRKKSYIAGHRVRYENTNSYLVFYYLDRPAKGDEILLEVTVGTTYEYRVTKQIVVDPDNVEVMEPEDGKTLVSLQTCTLPDYKQHLIV